MKDEYKDARVLHYLIVKKGFSQQKASDIIGCSRGNVRYWKNKLGIEKRKDYADPRVLQYLIRDCDMSAQKASEIIGCDQATVWNYAQEFGIERREMWRDPRVLHHLYVRRGFSMTECADILETSYGNVQKGMYECDIEPRKRPRDLLPVLHMDNGYEVFYQDYSIIQHHRLHFYAVNQDIDLEEMNDKEVHHKNGIRYDNRSENYELLTKAEHSSKHTHSTKEKV